MSRSITWGSACIVHIEHAYGFSPVWVRSCRGTALLSLNRRGHIEQAYGFSPVWDVHSCAGQRGSCW